MERKRRETPPAPKILDGEAEAIVIALYEGRQGYANRSLRLPTGKAAELAGEDAPAILRVLTPEEKRGIAVAASLSAGQMARVEMPDAIREVVPVQDAAAERA